MCGLWDVCMSADSRQYHDLRAWRKGGLGLSNRLKLGERLGVQTQVIGSWENGQRPPAWRVPKICEAYELSETEFWRLWAAPHALDRVNAEVAALNGSGEVTELRGANKRGGRGRE